MAPLFEALSVSDLALVQYLVRRCCDLRWAGVRFRWRCLGRRMSVADRGRELRRLLRDYPQWARGHVLLGLAELAEIRSSSARPAPRSLATLRVSGNAAVTLEQARLGSRSRSSRVQVEGKYLLGMVSFLLADYADALNRLTAVLAFNNARLLPRETCYDALENAGAAALALGEQKTAFEFFAQIPYDALSAESRSAYELLRSQG